MKTKTAKRKAWSELIPAEREERVKSAMGMFAGLTGGTTEFLREKHEETEREERKLDQRALDRNIRRR